MQIKFATFLYVYVIFISTFFSSTTDRLQQLHGKRADRVGEQRLLRRLLRDYDTDARGVLDPSHTVTVTIDLLLLRIQSLVRQMFGRSLYMYMYVLFCLHGCLFSHFIFAQFYYTTLDVIIVSAKAIGAIIRCN